MMQFAFSFRRGLAALSASLLNLVATLFVVCLTALPPSAATASTASGGGAGASLTLIESASTRRFFDTHLGQYDQILAQWRQFAERNKLALRMVSSEQLKSLPPGSVAVLPAMVALSERERADLEAAAQRGVSLLATWAFAPRDAQGTWLGYGFMKKLFDAEVVADVKADGAERFLQVYAQTPVTINQAPLKRSYLAKVQEPLLKAHARNPAARYADWSRSVSKENASHYAASWSEEGKSRRVWLGMPETSWSSAQADIDLLLMDSLNWLHKKPAAVLANWPAPYQSAMLLEMDTEDKFPNALLFEQELSRRGMRGTFYCLTDEAVKYPEVIKRLAKNHEIAYHADIHNGFKGVDPAAQKARLQRMIAAMTPLVSDIRKSTGFRAPLEEFDNQTEIILRSLGIRHHATTPNFADIALPAFSKAEPGLGSDEALVLLPRTMLDDVNFQSMGLLEKSVAGVLINSARVITDAGAFGLLSVHTQYYGADSALLRDMPQLLDFLAARKDKVWIASGDQLETWWREKQKVTLQTTAGAGQLDLKLNVTGTVRNAQVVVVAPSAEQAPKVQGAVPVTVQKLDGQRYALVFAELKAGVHQIRVSF